MSTANALRPAAAGSASVPVPGLPTPAARKRPDRLARPAPRARAGQRPSALRRRGGRRGRRQWPAWRRSPRGSSSPGPGRLDAAAFAEATERLGHRGRAASRAGTPRAPRSRRSRASSARAGAPGRDGARAAARSRRVRAPQGGAPGRHPAGTRRAGPPGRRDVPALRCTTPATPYRRLERRHARSRWVR